MSPEACAGPFDDRCSRFGDGTPQDEDEFTVRAALIALIAIPESPVELCRVLIPHLRGHLLPAKPKPIVKHRRVVEEDSGVVGGEDQMEVCRPSPCCGRVHRIADTIDLNGDDSLTACDSAAQHALVWPERPGLSVVVLSDQLRVTAARRSSRTWIARGTPGEAGNEQQRDEPSILQCVRVLPADRNGRPNA
jgi:hypothetical protein